MDGKQKGTPWGTAVVQPNACRERRGQVSSDPASVGSPWAAREGLGPVPQPRGATREPSILSECSGGSRCGARWRLPVGLMGLAGVYWAAMGLTSDKMAGGDLALHSPICFRSFSFQRWCWCKSPPCQPHRVVLTVKGRPWGSNV